MILCEPQCSGGEHVEINAALVAAVAQAFPKETIRFLAERDHLDYVMARLGDRTFPNLLGESIKIPPRECSKVRRYPMEFSLARRVFSAASSWNDSTILFSSVTTPGLLSIKALLSFHRNIRCAVIPHGILEEIVPCPWKVALRHPRLFRAGLLWNNSDRLLYVLLGKSIRDALCSYLPALEKFTRVLDHPYLFDADYPPLPLNGESVRFGFFGAAIRVKGADLLFRLAEDVAATPTRYRAEFELIGPVPEPGLRDRALSSPILISSPDAYLDRSDFSQRASKIHYALFLQGGKSYELRASGALFDALSFAKPIIALKNPFIEYHYKLMGDIGYLCNSYEELRDVIITILNSDVCARYESQMQAIVAARDLLSLEKSSSQIRKILE